MASSTGSRDENVNYEDLDCIRRDLLCHGIMLLGFVPEKLLLYVRSW